MNILVEVRILYLIIGYLLLWYLFLFKVWLCLVLFVKVWGEIGIVLFSFYNRNGYWILLILYLIWFF